MRRCWPGCCHRSGACWPAWALAAVEAARPGLPGAWCTLAADLAGRAGDTDRAGALLLEAGRRDLAVGALASAEHTLTRARAAIDPALRTSVDEALIEVFAMSGQVDRAMETGKMLLARLGPPSPRAANLHLGIARARVRPGGGPRRRAWPAAVAAAGAARTRYHRPAQDRERRPARAGA